MATKLTQEQSVARGMANQLLLNGCASCCGGVLVGMTGLGCAASRSDNPPPEPCNLPTLWKRLHAGVLLPEDITDSFVELSRAHNIEGTWIVPGLSSVPESTNNGSNNTI